MTKSTYHVKRMDCPSEERLVRMALETLPQVRSLEFDLATRTVHVWHEEAVEAISAKLEGLALGATLERTSDEEEAPLPPARPGDGTTDDHAKREARSLKTVLAINATMFVAEALLGFIAQSAGLIADSLDMFADAAVYGISLYAVGRAGDAQRRSARISGWIQATLSVGALVEVVRRFIFGSEPKSMLIIGVACVALVANVASLFILRGQRGRGVHMQASVIFSTNDVIANVGVIIGGVVVRVSGSALPDLAIGLIIAIVVLRGGLRILRIAKNTQSPTPQ